VISVGVFILNYFPTIFHFIISIFTSVPHFLPHKQYTIINFSHNRPEQAQGVPGRLRPRIFLTFGTTTVVGRQPYALAAFTSGVMLVNSFLKAGSTSGQMVPSVATEKSPVTDNTGNRTRDCPTSSAVP
jgi:hypothetical protein